MFPVLHTCIFFLMSAYEVCLKLFFKRDGRKKFRMAHHRKNEERKKAPSMLVSVPRDAITLSVGLMTIQSSTPGLHPAIQCQPIEETCPMLASFPISVFMQREITSVDVLLLRHKRYLSLLCFYVGQKILSMKKNVQRGDSNPYTLHVALSALISVDWARFKSLYKLSLV